MSPQRLQDTALRYFLEVVRSGSLAEASQRLHIAASALSRQIAGLEQALGAPLFERRPRGMVLTAAGELLAGHVRRASLDAEKTVEDIRALHELRRGRVRIAATEGLAGPFLSALVIEFRGVHPGVVFELEVTTPAAVTALVRQGEADIGMTYARGTHSEIRVEHRQAAPVHALVPAGHPLAKARSLTLKQLTGYPLALPGPNTTLRQLIDTACSRQQLQLQPVLSTDHMGTLHSFVVLEGGVSVSGELSARHLVQSGAVVARPLRDPGMDLRDIELQTLAGRVLPHAAQAFLAFLQHGLPQRLGPKGRRKS